jgi:putative serine protease PepD
MRQRILVGTALAGAGIAVAVGGVATWQALEDDRAATTTAAASTSAARPAADGDTLPLSEIYRIAAPAVVEIEATAEAEGGAFQVPGQRTASGSGFVLEGTGIITNEHVVEGATTVTVRFANGDEASARVVGTDPSTDVALLELEGDRDLTSLEAGSTEALEVGDPVAALGAPYGLEGTLTAGIVSALDREIRSPNGFTIDGAVQTDAPVNSGNSGGPLLDGQARVVGIVSQIESRNGGNVGIGYAVPIETVLQVAEQLRESGEVQHAYLGVQLAAEPAEDGGAQLAEVEEGGPADQAGVQSGDVVVAIDGEEVEGPDDVRSAVSAAEPGEEIELRILRNGEEQTVEVTLGERPDQVQ